MRNEDWTYSCFMSMMMLWIKWQHIPNVLLLTWPSWFHHLFCNPWPVLFWHTFPRHYHLGIFGALLKPISRIICKFAMKKRGRLLQLYVVNCYRWKISLRLSDCELDAFAIELNTITKKRIMRIQYESDLHLAFRENWRESVGAFWRFLVLSVTRSTIIQGGACSTEYRVIKSSRGKGVYKNS